MKNQKKIKRKNELTRAKRKKKKKRRKNNRRTVEKKKKKKSQGKETKRLAKQ